MAVHTHKYTSNNKIKLSAVPEIIGKGTPKYNKLSEFLSELVRNAADNFENTKKFKQGVVDIINIYSYNLIVERQVNPNGFNGFNISDYPHIEEDLCPWYLTVDAIDWDVEESTSANNKKSISELSSSHNKAESNNVIQKSSKIESSTVKKPKTTSKISTRSDSTKPSATNKMDLYIQPPTYPQLDINKLWMTGYDRANSKMIGIFESLPEVPTCQREISSTTQLADMTKADFINLYPTHLIHTRTPELYIKYDGYNLDYDDDLGALLPIGNGKYTREQLIDNIIRYPHLHNIRREYKDTGITVSKYRDDGTIHPLYLYIEIDGQLLSIKDVWNTDILPETKNIPPRTEYIRDYVVRRYLLERDIDHIQHKYPMMCDLRPYLTLFMPPEEYLSRGYIKDIDKGAVDLAKQCVESRILYHQSSNPMIRRIQNDPDVPQGKPVRDPCIFGAYCINNNCNEACIDYVQSNYLFMRNNILGHSQVLAADHKKLKDLVHWFNANLGKMSTYIDKTDTSGTAELFAYIAVCNTWKNSALKCRTYTLNYFHYLELKKASWNNNGSEELEYMNIWMRSANVLIVSNLDFVRFNDFACQELLGRLEERRYEPNFTTIIVSPPVSSLVGDGPFFPKLSDYIKRAIPK